MGEKFTANPATGTGSMAVPIGTSPGRSGFGPVLTLTYDSGSGNGPFGIGWNLGLPAITRKTDKGVPQYRDAQESDVFIISGAEDLVPERRSDGSLSEEDRDGYRVRRYRPRVEDVFIRIERWTRIASGEVHWRSVSPTNVTTVYGRSAESRIADPSEPTRVFSWLICESWDDKGNAMVYEYEAETSDGIDRSLANERNRTETSRQANRYLKRIRYGNRVSRLVQPDLAAASWLFEVVLDYDEDHYERLPSQDGENQLVRAAVLPGSAWSVRPDPFSRYRAGFELRTYRRCRRVLMFHRFDELGREPQLVRSTEFEYVDLGYGQQADVTAQLAHQGSTRFASFIRSVTQHGYVKSQAAPVVRGGATYLTYLCKSMPALEFDYSRAVIGDEVEDLAPQSLDNLPAGLAAPRHHWTDLDGEGLSGILIEQESGWFYKRNLSPLPAEDDRRTVARFGPVERLPTLPRPADLERGQRLLDLAGDGRTDVVDLDAPIPGYFERLPAGGWEAFRAFRSLPNADWQDPNLRFIDLTGDGLADVMLTEHEAFTWHAALGELGFGPATKVRQALDEERGPRVLFADGTESIHLADMSGDGLTDIVRVRNGEICYWPNLGHGRFGAKVTMDDAPCFDSPDQFDRRRIRLADVDGSGVTDIVYVGRDGVRLYLNQSGNRWSPGRRLRGFPRTDDFAGIDVVDLLGNGTACLVWSSRLPADEGRPMRYVRLMKEKPHLLTQSVNNAGTEIRIHYAPSTRFYLADKAAGRPWMTRLPFPVHVVERIETYDYVSRNRFVSRYAYHHGYFDGVEREFHGFGMVEQFDSEELGAFTANSTFPAAGNVDEGLHVPPVLTKTWFHTGAYVEGAGISTRFEREYYREGDSSAGLAGLGEAGARAMLLPDTELPTTVLRPDGTRTPWALSGEEAREACRALKGSILRVETYALDGTDAGDRPYAVSEHNYLIELLQPRGSGGHAVFLTRAKEIIDFEYERKLYDVDGQLRADPRVSHELTLRIDGYGNVLRSAAVAYGRRHPDPELAPADRNRQLRRHATITVARFTNPIDTADDYRAPLPCESRTYELLGATPIAPPEQPEPGVTTLFRPARLNAVFESAAAQPELPYRDWDVDEGALANPRLRLIEHVRTRYRADDMTHLLNLGELESLALAGEGYKLAFTADSLADIYGNRVTEAMLAGEGGYVHGDGDADWWVPSGRVAYSPGTGDSAAVELTYARQHFFQPLRYRDPFHTELEPTETRVNFDAYDLLPLQTEDALGNKVTCGERHAQPNGGETIAPRIDYRVLQPTLMTDPNGNRVEVAFDALGMVAGTAIRGKAGETSGDLLPQGFEADLSRPEIDAFFADPGGRAAALLGTATTRVVYDLHRYRRTATAPAPQPVFAATLVRETHVSDLAPGVRAKIRVSIDYSDGFGREIQKKVQAEPGPLEEGGPVAAARWVGSGWTVFDNKGKPVKEYEPFFDDGHGFRFDHRVGVSDVLFYDPGERVIATLHANHTYEKVAFDPWRQVSWDVNDTVRLDPRADPDVGQFVAGYFASRPADWTTWHDARSAGQLGAVEQAAATQAAAHAETPGTEYFDSLGRAFLSIADNGTGPDSAPRLHATRITFDAEGNEREIVDALDRKVMRYDYDMLNTRVHHRSMEAGEHWILHDVSGNPIRAWDSRGHVFRTEHDRLRRVVRQFVRGTDAAASDPRTLAAERLVEETLYGEGAQDDVALNLRTRVVRQHDAAGVVRNEAYDFKGNLTSSTRRLTRNHQALPDWAGQVALAPESYRAQTRYDALNRPASFVFPDGSELRPRYNEANLLEGLDVNLRGARDAGGQPVWTPLVTDIDYDAKGQRKLIRYGNGAETHYRYDPQTFRLVHVYTRRGPAFTEDCANPLPPPATVAAPAPPPGESCGLQNLHYTYDPAGNVVHVRDEAQQTIFFRNKRVEPNNHFVYDALYRLIAAQGREHLGQIGGSPIAHSHDDRPRIGIPWAANDGNAMGTYVEEYVYDAVGNILSMQHRGGDPAHAGWTRAYEYDEPSAIEPGRRSNRLSRTTVGGAPAQTFVHDAHGNMLRMPQLASHPDPQAANMHWDYEDRLRQADLPGGGVAHYSYDAAGQRVRKVVERAPGLVEERIYLGGFEIYRRRNGAGAVTLERETLHVTDDERRIAIVETRTRGTDPAPARLVRYQLANHLGSVSLELSGQAEIISYEEYSPYGSTTYQAVRSQAETPKRYRYTGKERDEESGLYYHGARYYSPWLARWTSCDPAFFVDGPNLFVYVKANPVRFVDPSGFGADEQSLGAKLERASKKHQDAANRLRKLKGKGGKPLKPIKVTRQKGVGGKRETIPDEVKKTPGSKKPKTVVDTKGRHVASKRNQSSAQRKADVKQNLDQVKKQVKELEAAGEVAPDAKGKALRVIHDSDKGKSSTSALPEWRKEAAEVRAQWVDEATDPAEKALRKRVDVVTTTRDRLTKATQAIEDSIKANKGKGGKLARVATKLGKAGRHFAAAVPVAGIVLGQASAAHAASQGDYTSAALDEAGFIPVAGDLLDAFRGGMALGEVASEVLPIEEAAMEAGTSAEKAAKYLGADDDAARVIGATGAAVGAVGEFVAWTNPVTAPFKIAKSLFD